MNETAAGRLLRAFITTAQSGHLLTSRTCGSRSQSRYPECRRLLGAASAGRSRPTTELLAIAPLAQNLAAAATTLSWWLALQLMNEHQENSDTNQIRPKSNELMSGRENHRTDEPGNDISQNDTPSLPSDGSKPTELGLPCLEPIPAGRRIFLLHANILSGLMPPLSVGRLIDEGGAQLDTPAS
jgi:hypothetical protein